MLVTIHGMQTSETMELHIERPEIVGDIIQIILAIHPRFFQMLPSGRDKSTLKNVLFIRTNDNTILTLEDTVIDNTVLEIHFHDMINPNYGR